MPTGCCKWTVTSAVYVVECLLLCTMLSTLTTVALSRPPWACM
jgi:hypothetical protein